jgi:ABC-type lipoprotein export system ATPase subunit
MAVTGPPVTGPPVAGPPVSGPPVSGPPVSGPPVSGPPVSGPASAPAGLGVTCRDVVYIYRLEGYDVVALAGVDLDIPPGEAVAMLGPSGSGKSTLLSVLAGLLPPSAGRVEVGGYDLVKASPAELHRMRAGDVGVVLQVASRNLLPYLSAEQNVRFAQRRARARRDPPDPREVLALVGLTVRGRTRLRPHALTPGERQRLALAVALANRPGLLLADEPTSQLDRGARDEVVAALDEVRRTGTTVVIVTHDPEVGARMRRTVTIRDGRVGAEGRLGEEYAVVGRDGTVHLPPEVLSTLVPGALLRVSPRPDGTVLLEPAGDRPPRPGPEPAPEPAPLPRRPAGGTAPDGGRVRRPEHLGEMLATGGHAAAPEPRREDTR